MNWPIPAIRTPQLSARPGSANQPSDTPTSAIISNTLSRIGAAAAATKRSNVFRIPDIIAANETNSR